MSTISRFYHDNIIIMKKEVNTCMTVRDFDSYRIKFEYKLLLDWPIVIYKRRRKFNNEYFVDSTYRKFFQVRISRSKVREYILARYKDHRMLVDFVEYDFEMKKKSEYDFVKHEDVIKVIEMFFQRYP